MESRAFTLIELLVTMGIVAVLLAIVIVAINPARQFAQTNNTRRQSDVKAILDAVGQYMVDNKGQIPSGITTTAQTISKTGADICAVLVTSYIAALPADPLTNSGTPITACSSTYTTGYTIIREASSGRITVAAPGAELSQTISVTR